jgi:RNA polymerase sigma-70 factor (ECF subfamily)
LQAAVAILGTADEAADAVQDAFVKAYLSIGKLKQPENFGPWLLRIVTNAAISRARTVRRRKDRRRLATEAVKDVPAQAGHTQPTLEL